jgi:hypothetical protein
MKSDRSCRLQGCALASSGIALWLLFLSLGPPPAWSQADPDAAPSSRGGVIVGRITHVEGQLLRYVRETDEWVATVKDAPFGLDDALYCSEQCRAEVILPNGTWVRMGPLSQIQAIASDPDSSEIDVASGVTRFSSRGKNTVVKVTTPFGAVVAPSQTTFDLRVGDASLELVAERGKVDFIHQGSGARYTARQGGASLRADRYTVAYGEGRADPAWVGWNEDRDRHWASRSAGRGPSVAQLPEELAPDAADLDDYGTWERVPYEGIERTLWRPTGVAAGWTPFSAGRWTDWHGDLCWIPAEPFGYVTHHYGHWVPVDDVWYWAPPVVSVGVTVGPSLGVGFFWYPGRVRWISSSLYIGWVPLTPFEPYYCRRPWGPRVVVVHERDSGHLHVDHPHQRHLDHAVIVPRKDFARVDNYQAVRLERHHAQAAAKDLRPLPAVPREPGRHSHDERERYRFTTAPVDAVPNAAAVERIRRNQEKGRRGHEVKGADILREAERARPGRPTPLAGVPAPRVPNRLLHAPAGGMTERRAPEELRGRGRGTDEGEAPRREELQRTEAEFPGKARGEAGDRPAPTVSSPGRDRQARPPYTPGDTGEPMSRDGAHPARPRPPALDRPETADDAGTAGVTSAAEAPAHRGAGPRPPRPRRTAVPGESSAQPQVQPSPERFEPSTTRGGKEPFDPSPVGEVSLGGRPSRERPRQFGPVQPRTSGPRMQPHRDNAVDGIDPGGTADTPMRRPAAPAGSRQHPPREQVPAGYHDSRGLRDPREAPLPGRSGVFQGDATGARQPGKQRGHGAPPSTLNGSRETRPVEAPRGYDAQRSRTRPPAEIITPPAETVPQQAAPGASRHAPRHPGRLLPSQGERRGPPQAPTEGLPQQPLGPAAPPGPVSER